MTLGMTLGYGQRGYDLGEGLGLNRDLERRVDLGLKPGLNMGWDLG